MNYEIPLGTFSSTEFARLNKIRHLKTAWRVLTRYVESGKIRLVNTNRNKKIYVVNTQLFMPRHVSNRTTICPPNQRDYILRLMGMREDGQCGGTPS